MMEYSTQATGDYIRILSQRGISIHLEEGHLKVMAKDDHDISEQDIQELRSRKEEVLKFLAAGQRGNSSNEGKAIPLSIMQESLWLEDRLRGTGAYHMPYVMKIGGGIEMRLLAYALSGIINRHAILRTVIREEGGVPCQQVLDARDFELEEEVSEEAFSADALQSFMDQRSRRPFDLAKDIKLRAGVVTFDDDHRFAWIILHHIAFDGWSIPVLMSELVELYASGAENGSPHLGEMTASYADYALWQREWLDSPEAQNELDHWTQNLRDMPLTEMPFDAVRPVIRSAAGRSLIFQLDEDLVRGLQQFVAKERTTFFMACLTIFKVLVYRYTGQVDIGIGSVLANRDEERWDGLIGYFANTVVLRTKVRPWMSFREYSKAVKDVVLDAQEHSRVPFEKVAGKLKIERDLSANALFGLMFSLQSNALLTDLALGDCTLHAEVLKKGLAKFDLSFDLIPASSGAFLEIGYSTELFSEQAIYRMFGHYQQIMRKVVDDPEINIAAIDLMSPEETRNILFAGNHFDTGYIPAGTINGLFEERVKERPDAVAISFMGARVSYRELAMRADILAGHLVARGLVREDKVAICLDKKPEMIVAILAVLKAGGAYVPIDPAYPPARVSFMVKDTGAKIVLCDPAYRHLFAGHADLLPLDPDTDCRGVPELHTISNGQGSPEDLAYVIYTSGSTGTPKGVLIGHKSVIHLVEAADYVPLNANSVLLSTAAFPFDATTFEFWGILLNGGTLVLAPQERLLDVAFLKRTIQENKINIVWFTASWLHGLIDQDITIFKDIDVLLGGGDTLSKKHIDSLMAVYPRITVINGYGPTENTTFSLCYNCRNGISGRSIPIGKPINHSVVYILDRELNLLPCGIPGEIFVGGPGLARGYLNMEEQTREKFVKNPFGKGRLYRTGDTGRWLNDGNIEFIGRADDQLKVRGFRVEIGEIEETLRNIPEVEQAAVVAFKSDNGENILVAYIVPHGEPDKASIHSKLRGVLPAYMIPSFLIELDALPLTNNGKLDRKRLPEPHREKIAVGKFTLPENVVEEKMLELWEEVLAFKGIGTQDDFFTLGGHSMKAMVLISRLEGEFGVALGLADLFANPTIASLSRLVHSTGKSDIGSIPLAGAGDGYVLSSGQLRLWILSLIEETGCAYNVHGCYILKGNIDIPALSRSFEEVVGRHEILRTLFTQDEEGAVKQFIRDKKDFGFGLSVDHLPGGSMEREEIGEIIRTELSYPFDLSKDRLFRARLLQTAKDEFLLICVLHHIVCDAWSLDLLIKEISSYYSYFAAGHEPELPALRLQYKDYATWQQALLKSGRLAASREHWMGKLRMKIPVLDLPFANPRPGIKTYHGRIEKKRISNDLYGRLRKIQGEEGVTMFTLLLAALKALLYRYTGENDLVVGSPVTIRSHSDIRDQLGFYLNTLAFRTTVDGEESFLSLLKRVKSGVLADFQHQEYPFDRILEDIGYSEDISRSPLFDVMMVYLDGSLVVEDNVFGPGGAGIRVYEPDGLLSTSKFDMMFTFRDAGGGLELFLEYNTDLFEGRIAKRTVDHFEALLEHIAGHSREPLYKANYLTAEELGVLCGYNDTAAGYTLSEAGVVGLFERCVKVNPQRTALVCNETTYTYEELFALVDEFGRYLHAKYGIGLGSPVGVLVPRSPWSVIAMLSILKLGGVYVPLDGTLPVHRLRYMITDSEVEVLITCKYGMEAIAGVRNLSLETLSIDLPKTLPALDTIAPPMDSTSYIIYTSGSTGSPKGVEQTYLTLYNLIRWSIGDSGLLPAGRHLLYSTFGFDMSLHDVFITLCAGGELHVLDDEIRGDLQDIRQYIVEKGITRISMSYTALQALFTELGPQDLEGHRLREIISTGEQLYIKGGLRNFLGQAPEIALYNFYGPSETHVVTGIRYSSVNGILPVKATIGRPIANSQIYILDAGGQLVPRGMPGEIYIGGWNVARGYRGNPELTKRKFIESGLTVKGRLYKSGDIGCWLDNGEIEYLGRKDGQVKISGYRIELEEIRHALLDYDGIGDAVVVVKKDSKGNEALVAYFTQEDPVDIPGLRQHLKGILPHYMLPAHYCAVRSFLFNGNGKIDKSVLPEPIMDHQTLAGDLRLPETPTEMRIAGMWQDVLGMERVGRDVNFFEAGGTSLKAMVMMARINRSFSTNLKLSHLFLKPTVGELAASIGNARKEALPDIRPGAAETLCAVSPGQEMILLFDQFNPHARGSYNILFLATVSIDLDRTILRRALEYLVGRHESLRTHFSYSNGTFFQQVRHFDKVLLDYEDVSFMRDKEIYVREKAKISYDTAFELEKGPLYRWALFRLGPSDYRLMFSFHHIIFDGWSANLFFDELFEVYTSLSRNDLPLLKDLPVQYRDYSRWYHKLLAEGHFKDSFAYWERKLGAGWPGKRLPADRQYPSPVKYAGHVLTGAIENADLTRVGVICQMEQVSYFVFILSCVSLVIYDWTGDRDIVIGTPAAGRSHEDLEGQIGYYVNMIPLRFRYDPEMSFNQWLHVVAKELSEALDHQMTPYSSLIEAVGRQGKLFNIVVNMIDVELNKKYSDMLRFDSIHIGDPWLKNDLTFHFYRDRQALHLMWTGLKELFRIGTLDLMRTRFQDILQIVQSQPSILISELLSKVDGSAIKDDVELNFNIGLE